MIPTETKSLFKKRDSEILQRLLTLQSRLFNTNSKEKNNPFIYKEILDYLENR